MTLLPWIVATEAHGAYENPIKLPGPNGPIKNVPEFLIALVDMAFLIAMPIIVAFIVYAGFLFLTAGDNEQQTTKSKHVFMWTFIGAAIAIGAKVLAAAIQATILEIGGG